MINFLYYHKLYINFGTVVADQLLQTDSVKVNSQEARQKNFPLLWYVTSYLSVSRAY